MTQSELVYVLCVRQRQLNEALDQGHIHRANALQERVLSLAERILYGNEYSIPETEAKYTPDPGPTAEHKPDPFAAPL